MIAEAIATLRGLLVQRRHRLGLSQRQAGDRIGMAQTSLSGLERKSTGHSLEQWAKWAGGLQIEFGVYLVVDGHYETIALTPSFDDDPSWTEAAEPQPLSSSAAGH